VRSEGVIGIEGSGFDLAEDLAVGEVGWNESVARPEGRGGGEDGLVEDVIISKEGVRAAVVVSAHRTEEEDESP